MFSILQYNAGWFGAADIQRAYGKEAQGGDVKAAAKKAAIVWATGIPVSLNLSCDNRILLLGVLCYAHALYATMVLSSSVDVEWVHYSTHDALYLNIMQNWEMVNIGVELQEVNIVGMPRGNNHLAKYGLNTGGSAVRRICWAQPQAAPWTGQQDFSASFLWLAVCQDYRWHNMLA